MPAAPPSCDGQPLGQDAPEPAAGLEDPDEPAGRLEPERRRHGLLEQGAGGHRRLAMLAREAAHAAATRSSSRQDEPEGAARDEHRGRVEDVLARRAPVDVAGGVVADGLAQRPDERLDRVAGRAALLGERVEVEELGAARLRDPAAASAGITPACASAARAPARPSSIASSHGASDTASRSSAGTKIEREGRQCAKKTVCSLALHVDVEASAPSLLLGDERRRARPRERREHRVGGVRLGSSGK